MPAISKPINTVITTATYATVTIPSNHGLCSVMLKSRSGSSFYISDLIAGTTYVTVPAGNSVSFDIGPDDTILCYAKASAATDTLEALFNVLWRY